MAKHNETGIKGEQIAENFLLKKGYKILERNHRTGKKEIDLIASLNNTIVFVEVKTRTNTAFGLPEDAVNERKKSYLRAAAEQYLNENNLYQKMQFDIISIVLQGADIIEILHFEDAFY